MVRIGGTAISQNALSLRTVLNTLAHAADDPTAPPPKARLRSTSNRVKRWHQLLADPEFVNDVWSDAMVAVIADTGRDDFPDECPWPMSTVLAPDWLPA